MQAVVLAGGRGTRLNAAQDALPKPLVPLCGAPVLDHIIGRLAPQGVDDVVVCSGYRADVVEQVMGDGARHGVRLRYSVESSPLGTAGAVRAAMALLADRFVIAYGDVVADVDLAAMLQAHVRSGALATLAVHPNDHPFDSDRVVTDVDGYVVRMVTKDDHAGPEAGALCNAAFYVVEKRLLDIVPDDGKSRDFARDVFPALVRDGHKLFAYRTAEYLRDMGTTARRAHVEHDLRAGVPARMRRGAGRAAVLIDRDGVLIEDVPYVKHTSEVRVLPGVTDALKQLNAARVLAACCTNQPVVARGDITEAQLHEVHRYMEGTLGAGGAWLDDIFVCTHHPDRGFAGERADLKVACECRKPLPGLIFQAEAALGFDRRVSIFVGDRTTDLRAARAAGVLGVGVATGAACRDGRDVLWPEVPVVPSLSEAVALLLVTAPSWGPWLDAARAARVVVLGGPSRAGKTVAATALRLALHAAGVETLHLSLDRFILPRSARRAEAPVRERTRFDDAARAVNALVAGDAVLLPGYDPVRRESAPSEIAQWDRRGVLIVDGVLANALDVAGALSVALGGDAAALRARRQAFYGWKGLTGPELEDAVDGRAEEHQAIAAATQRATLRLALDGELRLAEAP